VTAARNSPGQVTAALAVLLALAALAAFSLWGMKPSASTATQAAPATTTQSAPAGERERGHD
jgi:hypothetical protein